MEFTLNSQFTVSFSFFLHSSSILFPVIFSKAAETLERERVFVRLEREKSHSRGKTRAARESGWLGGRIHS